MCRVRSGKWGPKAAILCQTPSKSRIFSLSTQSLPCIRNQGTRILKILFFILISNIYVYIILLLLPGGQDEGACSHEGRPRLNPWVRRLPGRNGNHLSTLPGNSHGRTCRLQLMGHKELWHNWVPHFHFLSYMYRVQYSKDKKRFNDPFCPDIPVIQFLQRLKHSGKETNSSRGIKEPTLEQHCLGRRTLKGILITGPCFQHTLKRKKIMYLNSYY